MGGLESWHHDLTAVLYPEESCARMHHICCISGDLGRAAMGQCDWLGGGMPEGNIRLTL